MRAPIWITALAAIGCTDGASTDGTGEPCATPIVAYADNDGDGFGGAQIGEVCALGDGEVDVPGDCDDDDDERSPDADETCNGLDDDCNGEIDDGLDETRVWYTDADGDGFGTPFPAQSACEDPGGGWADNDLDCDDSDPDVSPAAVEVCNGGLDDDCDYLADDADGDLDTSTQSTFYEDRDSDGFGNPQASTRACSVPSGYTTNDLDCGDQSPTRNPDATEVCNGLDDNCDTLVDDADPAIDTSTQTSFFVDADNDGWGAPGQSLLACTGGPGRADNDLDCNDSVAQLNLDDADGDGWTTCDGDCNDASAQVSPEDIDYDGFTSCDAVPDCEPSNPTVYPGAPETVVDGIDQDCDGADDCYLDADGDTYGSTAVIGGTTLSCTGPGEADNDDDCDDSDDRQTVPRPWYDDLDLDGYGAGVQVSFGCTPPYAAAAANADDCDDSDPDTYPGAPEICTDLIDQDCDGDLSCCQYNECLTQACFGDEVCCPNDVIGTPPIQLSGTTSGKLDYHQPSSCSLAGGAGDMAFEFVAPATANYTFDTFGSPYDTTLYALTDCQGAEIACNDDTAGLQSEITVGLNVGERVIIVVDGFAASTGDFVLNVQ